MAILPVDSLRFASLGSSHINQVLRNVLGRAVALDCPDGTDAAERLNLQVVEAHDSALAEACRVGFLLEVLSGILETERSGVLLHPGGAQ